MRGWAPQCAKGPPKSDHESKMVKSEIATELGGGVEGQAQLSANFCLFPQNVGE